MKPALRLTIATFGLAASTVLAAQPVNDNFADRITLSGARVTATGSNAGATREPDEPIYNGTTRSSLLHTVWWSWTAPGDGVLAVSALASDYPAVVDVATGATLSELHSMSESLGNGWWQRTLRVPVSAGTAYQIVAGTSAMMTSADSTGNIILNLAFFERPPNDDFSDRIHLGDANVSVNATNTAATIEPGEDRLPFQSYGRTIWWSWTASASGPVTIGLEASPLTSEDLLFDEYPGVGISLGIYVGDSVSTAATITNRFSWDYFGAPGLSQVTFDAVAGTTYQVAADASVGVFDTLTLRIARTRPPLGLLTSPLNGAEFVAGTSVTAVAEAIDQDGTVSEVEFFLRGSYGLEQWAARDATPPFRAMWTNLAPARYNLAARVTDNLGATADAFPITFNVRPANDNFARRIPFTGAFNTVTGTLANASSEPGEPLETGSGSVWWEWTAPASGTFTIVASSLGYSPVLTVFAGNAWSDLTLIASSHSDGNDSSYSTRVVIAAEAGKTYRIALSTGGHGSGTLTVAQTTPPDVAITNPTPDATFMVGEPVTFTATASDPDGVVRRVEFVLDDTVVLGVVTNSPFTLVHTFTEGWMRHRVVARATDDAGVTTTSTLVWFDVVYPGPPNDNFADRIAFTGSFVSVTGTITNATSEVGEPSVLSSGSAWWAWTAPESGVFTITVESPSGDFPALAVFNGATLADLELITNSSPAGFSPGHLTHVVVQAQVGVTYPIGVGSCCSGSVLTLSVARTLPPVVSIKSPTNQAMFFAGEEITIAADASDPDGTVRQVEFHLDDSLLAVVTNGPFALSLTPTNRFTTYHWLEAWATDDLGVRTVSDAVQFGVRPLGPPNDDFTNRVNFTGSFVIVTGSTADATSEPGEDNLVWPGSVWWAWTAPDSADYTITLESEPGFRPWLAVFTGSTLADLNRIASAWDDGTNLSRVVLHAEAGTIYPIAVGSGRDISLSVARGLPPSVSITEPASSVTNQTNGVVVFVGQTVSLAADATDPDGSVSRVEFYLGDGRLLGTVTNAPFVLNVTLPLGSQCVRAHATDDQGLTTISPQMCLTVEYPPPPNDTFTNRIPLFGTLIFTNADMRGATLDPDEPPTPPLFFQLGSVWYSWTAPASGNVLITSSGGTRFLGVYKGSDLTNLVAVATSPSTDAYGWGQQLEFAVIAGTEYQLQVVAEHGFQGFVSLTLFLDALELRNPRMLGGDLFAFDFRTTVERGWTIEASTNLVDWTPLAKRQCADGTLEFQDPGSTGHPQQFYRAVAEP